MSRPIPWWAVADARKIRGRDAPSDVAAVLKAAKAWLESFDSVEGNGFSDDAALAAEIRALLATEGE